MGDHCQKIKSLRNQIQRQIDEKRALQQQSDASVNENEVKTNQNIETLKQEIDKNINEKEVAQEKGFESLQNQYQKRLMKRMPLLKH